MFTYKKKLTGVFTKSSVNFSSLSIGFVSSGKGISDDSIGGGGNGGSFNGGGGGRELTGGGKGGETPGIKGKNVNSMGGGGNAGKPNNCGNRGIVLLWFPLIPFSHSETCEFD